MSFNIRNDVNFQSFNETKDGNHSENLKMLVNPLMRTWWHKTAQIILERWTQGDVITP